MSNNLAPVTFSNISATPSAFSLIGGVYALEVIATWGGGSVTLNRRAGDGSTYVSTGIVFSANGFQTVQLPSGTYQLAVVTATAIYADIVPIATIP